MLFGFLLATAGVLSLGLRPEAAGGLDKSHSTAASVGHLGDLVASAVRASTPESLESLSQASGILSSMMQAGNATEHMSDEDMDLMRRVLALIEETIYASMDSSHQADQDALQSALAAIAQCNSGIAARLAADGDLDDLHQGTLEFQSTLNDKQADVVAKTEINNTKFGDLVTHISNIREAPACSSFPANPTKLSTDVFFGNSEYVSWYEAQKEAYAPIAQAFEASNTDLDSALTARAVAEGERDVSYCDWKAELTDGCAAFDTCYSEKLEYKEGVFSRVQQDMKNRVDAYKAGETIIDQIRFLLAESTSASPPAEIDTSRYELTFPDAAGKGECSLAPLDANDWVPFPSCPPPAPGGPGKGD